MCACAREKDDVNSTTLPYTTEKELWPQKKEWNSVYPTHNVFCLRNIRCVSKFKYADRHTDIHTDTYTHARAHIGKLEEKITHSMSHLAEAKEGGMRNHTGALLHCHPT